MLLEKALRSGISALEYWQMTPREVYAAIDASNWRQRMDDRAEHLEGTWMIWHLAAMLRSKEMPSLKALQAPPKAQVLTPEEAEKRRKEHQQMVKALPERLKGKVQGE